MSSNVIRRVIYKRRKRKKRKGNHDKVIINEAERMGIGKTNKGEKRKERQRSNRGGRNKNRKK